MLNGYGHREHRRALDAMLERINSADTEAQSIIVDCDRIIEEADRRQAAAIARMSRAEIELKLECQRLMLAPHGHCPNCNEPLYHEPDSLEPYEYAGARGTHVLRGGYGCGECCIVIPEDKIVRVA